MVDQRRFDDQHQQQQAEPETITARAAATRLDVKLATLYAYVSRGLVRSYPGGHGRPRRYAREDVERLKKRHDARAGHGAVAAGALRWGEPVLESAISKITERGPAYRGRPAVELAEKGESFEAVADLLWTGDLPSERPCFEARDLGVDLRALRELLPRDAHVHTRLALFVAALGAADPARFADSQQAIVAHGRTLIIRMVAALVPGLAERRVSATLRAGRDHGVAYALALALDPALVQAARGEPRIYRHGAVRAIETALIVSADHELNVSAFAARVAASAGADLHACLSAALAALAGPRHGGAPDRVDALILETAQPSRAAAVIADRARRGEEVPGFGHPLYPHGDPRALPLIAAAERLAPRALTVRTALALAAAMRAARQEHPTIDFGLVVLAAALGVPPGSAPALFAIGRTAGWIAHIIEQRADPFLLRPRARYVGPGDGV
jgi:citrate synthase